MFQVLIKEINSFFNSLVGYIVLIVFLVGIGLFTWVFPQTSILNYGFANLDPLFTLAPYVFMFLIPAVTMRTFAEEKKGGTMELLLTRPLTDWEIILGKYFSSLLLVLFALIPTVIYYFSVHELGSPQGNIDSAGVAGSYIGLICLAGVFTAIGVFASSITDNQIVAFIFSVFLCFLLYEGITSIAAIDVWASYSYYLAKVGIDYHYNSVSRGLVDSRNLIYFFSMATGMLALTKLVLGSRKW
ncbi:gliding motility-associated ABC transporter permease subunit GldF [Rapidithrix thailandica]|uniref:Gliding motility-associated ABC transporter permease subunit GldF n=1 Tax=Rapidithrix thailandica TaxID=413964 RepID=A0AAW9S5J7_9BACT